MIIIFITIFYYIYMLNLIIILLNYVYNLNDNTMNCEFFSSS